MGVKIMQSLEPLAVVIGIAVGMISCLTFVGGLFAFIWTASRKNYAAQRDMVHFKNNQKQIVENMGFLSRDADNNFRLVQTELSEIKSKLEILLTREG